MFRQMAYNIGQMAGFSISERLITSVKKGFPFSEFETLQQKLGVSANELGQIVGIPERTLVRRRQDGRLMPDESDRLFRIHRITTRATEVIGKKSGISWMTTPKRFLNGKTPLEYSDTEIGAYEIEQALGRLEHGVFS